MTLVWYLWKLVLWGIWIFKQHKKHNRAISRNVITKTEQYLSVNKYRINYKMEINRLNSNIDLYRDVVIDDLFNHQPRIIIAISLKCSVSWIQLSSISSTLISIHVHLKHNNDTNIGYLQKVSRVNLSSPPKLERKRASVDVAEVLRNNSENRVWILIFGTMASTRSIYT